MNQGLTSKQIGSELAAHFRRKHLSQAQVAEKFGVKQSWIARIYAGNFTSRSKTARDMCRDAKISFNKMIEDGEIKQQRRERKLEGMLAEVWEGTQEDADFLVEALRLLKKIKSRKI